MKKLQWYRIGDPIPEEGKYIATVFQRLDPAFNVMMPGEWHLYEVPLLTPSTKEIKKKEDL